MQDAIRFYFNPTVEDYTIGFRVASSEAVPEPASIVGLLGMALTGLALRRRRKSVR